jgi:heme/copper-type cytochrome/quinol oxidase subunit 4
MQGSEGGKRRRMKRNYGKIIAMIGMAILVINALGYFLHLDIGKPQWTLIGLIFVLVGLKLVRRI